MASKFACVLTLCLLLAIAVFCTALLSGKSTKQVFAESSLPTTLSTPPTFNVSDNTITGSGSESGYSFADDTYTATVGSVTLGGTTYTNAVTISSYTNDSKTQVVVPSQMKIGGIDCQVILSGNVFMSKSNITSISFASVSGTKVLIKEHCINMFYGCSSLKSLNISNLDTSNVTKMTSMFVECSSLTSLDLSSFNTSSVTDMSYMFGRCLSLTSLDLSSFDTRLVTTMEAMFGFCPSLTSLDLSKFNTNLVTNMSYMFASCSSLTSLDISSFNTSGVTNFSDMFTGSDKLNVIKTPQTVSSIKLSDVGLESNKFFVSTDMTQTKLEGTDNFPSGVILVTDAQYIPSEPSETGVAIDFTIFGIISLSCVFALFVVFNKKSKRNV